MEDFRCLAMGRVVADPGIIIVGGMGAEGLMILVVREMKSIKHHIMVVL
jgi:hypothetical protein